MALSKTDLLIVNGILFLEIMKRLDMGYDYLIYACSEVWFNNWTMVPDQASSEKSPIGRLFGIWCLDFAFIDYLG